MSYIPDYRSEKNYAKLKKEDLAYIRGYQAAIEDALCLFNNLDVYELEANEKTDEIRDCLESWMDMEEQDMVCSVFCADDSIEDIDDVNPMKGRFKCRD